MFATPAFAQTAGAAGQAGGAGSMIGFFVQMGLILVAFYFLMIRPQQKRAKALRDAVAAVKKGDQVVTAGGIVGKATKVEDQFVEVEIAPNVRIRVVKATLAEVTPSGSGKPAND